MILVDTSVWVDFINNHRSREGEALAELIEAEEEIVTCGLVVAEVMQGLRRHRDRFEALFADLPFLADRGLSSYLDAASLFRELRRRGITVRSTVDCVIAQLASEAGALLLTKDRDLRAILDSRLTSAREWRP